YITEVMEVIWAIKWAVSLGFRKIIINFNSKSVVNTLKTGNVPWFVIARWLKACNQFQDIKYMHCFREINFSADSLAKKGSRLNLGKIIHHSVRPNFFVQVEMPGRKYLRFCS
ncbi:hypothetical protein MKX01_024148, partial [Papaver californicum]